MTAGDSKAALTITPQPALAPSPQPRPAPTARALPPGLVAQVGQNWTPIVGQNWMPIDTPASQRYARPVPGSGDPWQRRSWKQAASRLLNPMTWSVCLSRSAPASDVIDPPSKLPTTSRRPTGANPNRSGLHSVGIGAVPRISQKSFSQNNFR